MIVAYTVGGATGVAVHSMSNTAASAAHACRVIRSVNQGQGDQVQGNSGKATLELSGVQLRLASRWDRGLRYRRRDLASGAFVALIGAVFVAESFAYEIGTASEMRAGCFPMTLGVLAIVLGAAIGIGGRRKPTNIIPNAWQLVLAGC